MSTEKLILFELLLVFGGVLCFGWWQLSALRKRKKELEDASVKNIEKANQDDIEKIE